MSSLQRLETMQINSELGMLRHDKHTAVTQQYMVTLQVQPIYNL